MADIEGIIFDLYGTLMHIVDEKEIYQRLFTDLGLRTRDEYTRARNIALTENFEDLADLVKRIKPNFQIDLDLYQQELEKELQSASLYPEVTRVLHQLVERNIKLGVLSNVASPYKRPFFNLGCNEYFDEILFSCDLGLKKPDPRIYQKMIEKMGINPAHILMIGDSMHADVDGPRSVGINAVHLDRSNFSAKSIPSLEGVFQYL